MSNLRVFQGFVLEITNLGIQYVCHHGFEDASVIRSGSWQRMIRSAAQFLRGGCFSVFLGVAFSDFFVSFVSGGGGSCSF